MGWTKEFLKDNENHFTVYMHVNKYNNKKYIGITGRNPKERWHGGNGYCRNLHFNNAIKKYGWDNFEHIIIADNLTKEKAIEMEIALIKKYNTQNNKFGYNIASGGEGVNGLSKESIEKIRQANIGRICSEETRKKISESRRGTKNWRYGKKLSETHKEILLKANKGRKKTEAEIESIINTRGFITYQYDIDGNFINSFRSTGEAARELKIHASGIKACCEKRVASNHNFIFRYEKDGYKMYERLPSDEVMYTNSKKNKFQICQLDDNGNIIKIFPSCTEAGRELHIDRHDISDCVRGVREFAGGFKWKKIS